MKRTIRVVGQQRRKFWEDHLRAWQASGLSQAGYCREQGLSNRGFVYWKKRLTSAKVAVSLVVVPRFQTVSREFPSKPLRLMLGNRYGIEIERGFDEQTLARLLRILDKR